MQRIGISFKTLIGCMLAVGCVGVMAQEKSSESEALALLKSAQDYIKTNGVDKAFEEFNRLDSPFNVKSDINPKGDLYLYTLDFNGYQVVHGKNPKIRGKVMIDMRDVDGVFLIRDMRDVCKSKGFGKVEYRWPNPVSKNVEPKIGIIQLIPGTQICLGTGIYK